MAACGEESEGGGGGKISRRAAAKFVEEVKKRLGRIGRERDRRG